MEPESQIMVQISSAFFSGGWSNWIETKSQTIKRDNKKTAQSFL
jgi:hypothetical protein